MKSEKTKAQHAQYFKGWVEHQIGRSTPVYREFTSEELVLFAEKGQAWERRIRRADFFPQFEAVLLVIGVQTGKVTPERVKQLWAATSNRHSVAWMERIDDISQVVLGSSPRLLDRELRRRVLAWLWHKFEHPGSDLPIPQPDVRKPSQRDQRREELDKRIGALPLSEKREVLWEIFRFIAGCPPKEAKPPVQPDPDPEQVDHADQERIDNLAAELLADVNL